jgi:hypothetical protein
MVRQHTWQADQQHADQDVGQLQSKSLPDTKTSMAALLYLTRVAAWQIKSKREQEVPYL